MAREVQCEMHGSGREAFVCHHLLGDAVGLGFNSVSEPSADDPYPDAWCDDCEIIRAEHDGWDEESQKLTKIVLLCSGCYERARIRNTRTEVTLDDLANLRWKCTSCEEWHHGPILDVTHDAPHYWREEYPRKTPPGSSQKTFLNEDYCQIDDDYFVRGIIQLPIVGTDQHFCWGVWGSLSSANFDAVIEKGESSEGAKLPRMFSWLSTRIAEYPDTLNLKMFARIQKPGARPFFELEPADHPLAHEFHEGITPARVRELTLKRVDASEG